MAYPHVNSSKRFLEESMGTEEPRKIMSKGETDIYGIEMARYKLRMSVNRGLEW